VNQEVTDQENISEDYEIDEDDIDEENQKITIIEITQEENQGIEKENVIRENDVPIIENTNESGKNNINTENDISENNNNQENISIDEDSE